MIKTMLITMLIIIIIYLILFKNKRIKYYKSILNFVNYKLQITIYKLQITN